MNGGCHRARDRLIFEPPVAGVVPHRQAGGPVVPPSGVDRERGQGVKTSLARLSNRAREGVISRSRHQNIAAVPAIGVATATLGQAILGSPLLCPLLPSVYTERSASTWVAGIFASGWP
jgi:hypothetical protein